MMAKKKAARKAAAKKKAPTKKKAPAKKKAAAKKVVRKAPAKKAAPKPPPGADVRALAKRIVALTVANDDEATFGLYDPNVESAEMGQPATRGLDALRTKFEGWRNFVSSARFEPKRVVVDGNTIVIEWVGNIVLAATGKEAQMHEVAVHEVKNGKIVREAYFYNPAALA